MDNSSERRWFDYEIGKCKLYLQNDTKSINAYKTVFWRIDMHNNIQYCIIEDLEDPKYLST